MILALLLLLGLLGLLAVSAAVPAIDWAASRVFFREDGFPLAHVAALERVRDAIWNAEIAVCLVLMALWLALRLRGHAAASDRRPFAFASLTYLLGPGLLVHVILKEEWHRARPRDMVEFGGSLRFSAPGRIAGECLSNCSFPSGEAAGAAATAIVLLVLLGGRHRAAGMIVAALAILATALRVAVGAHWLSDVLASWILVALVARIVWHLTGMERAALPRLRWLKADLAALVRPTGR